MIIKNELHETTIETIIEKNDTAFFFIHGFGSSNKVWDFISPRLNGSKFFIPFPGHLGSIFNGKESFDFVNTVYHIFETINKEHKLERKRKVLMVHSASSAIILYYLFLYKNMFSEIIFVTPAINLDMKPSSPLFPLVNFLGNDYSDFIWDLTFNKIRNQFKSFNWFRELFITGGTYEHKLPIMCDKNWIEGYFEATNHSYEILKLIVISARKTSDEISDKLNSSLQEIYSGALRNRFKTLTIGSLHDSLISHTSHELNAKCLDGKLITFTESSHLPMLEESERFVKEINNFLND
jgi:pimeloyl-ACP methyl ester carboxylesterase